MEEREGGLWQEPLVRNRGQQSLISPWCITVKKNCATPNCLNYDTLNLISSIVLEHWQQISKYPSDSFFGERRFFVALQNAQRRKKTRQMCFEVHKFSYSTFPPLLHIWWINIAEKRAARGVVKQFMWHDKVKTAELSSQFRNDSVLGQRLLKAQS